MTDHDLRPPTQQRRARNAGKRSAMPWTLAAVALAAAVVGGWWAKDRWEQPAPVAAHAPRAAAEVAPVVPEAPPAPEPAVQPEAPVLAAEPASPQHPLMVEAADALEATDTEGFERNVTQWLGREAVLKFIAMPGLAHHIVATIDNLPRSHAAPRLWPLHPVGGRMITAEEGGQMWIAPANSSRYDALVGFVTGIDPAQAADMYRKAYPVLQQAYENLGYPGQHFNDRLVAVIDHLLQTPEVAQPMAIQLVQVQGAVAPQQPWLRYEFADAQLQSLSAGQKQLLRMDTAHRQQLKAYLQVVRAQIAQP